MPSPHPPPPRLTHFLALTSSSLQDPTTTNFPLTLHRFRDLATSPTYNIPPAAIRPLGTMHLTLGVMALKNAEELARATAALGGAVEASGGRKGGVRVKLSGLKTFEGRGGRRGGRGGRGKRGGHRGAGAAAVYFDGEGEQNTEDWETGSKQQEEISISDYRNCRVLWVEPRDASTPPITTTTTTIGPTCEHGLGMVLSREENTSNLLTLANSLRDHYASLGLLHFSPKDKNQPLTLHMTVLNAVYAQERKRGVGGRGSGGRGGKGNLDGYDVRGLVEEFKDVAWAEEVLFDRLEVMRMGEVQGEEGSARAGESWYESVESVLL
ncbi:hypothetical protein L211DRAFT_868888 [Terfezia boudieri ATCC MYA-4762]|uniref:A-kinase anchor protein 7-like phosphoesterase domain-containing protein n=1 Tax=Terfezia boudieri ATCC MYA-4762 TaxID=1051890 RepID=A0A3N4LJJ4_9PEZI|nr:hypothetical protein L211DRAFT_868888 [Terfezia boudieri ATCC MYA-4762]